MPSRVFWIENFKGLNEKRTLGGDPSQTTSLDGVEVRHGRVYGVLGTDELNSITDATSATIIGLSSYTTQAGATTVLRTSTTKVEKLGASSWTDITGSITIGASTATRPQNTNIDQKWVETPEGTARPYKWSGTGNIAAVGGTPPFCKALASYVGYLLLGNISDDGSFTDLTNGAITVRYSDDWDADWSACRQDGTSNGLILDETPGEIRAAGVVGRVALFLKSDGIVAVRFIGGSVVFAQDKLDFDLGIIAPLSFQVIGDAGAIFLATDMELYFTDGQHVKPLPPNVSKQLQEVEAISQAKDMVATIEPDKETYHLYYHRTGATWLDGRLSYNYRTGEFFKRSYAGQSFTRAHWYRASNTDSTHVIQSATTLVYNADSGQNDNGTRVTHNYDTDWHHLGLPGDKVFIGAALFFKRKAATRCRVSLAKDFDPNFKFAHTYELKGQVTTQEEVRIQYKPPPQAGSWFNLRVEMLNDGSTNVPELRAIGMEFIPVREAVSTVPKVDSIIGA